jgi:hypothetical protein
MDTTKYTQDVKRQRWVAEAADRAEQRSGSFRSHQTPLEEATHQLQQLIAAVMSPRLSRVQLRALAKAITEGRV